MRYILNDSGYIEAISFGCFIECKDKTCTEYTGSIPEGYETLAIWSETANINAYKITDGNLTYDSEEDARLQALWKSQLGTNKNTIFSGVLMGGEATTLKGVKRYLDVYFRITIQNEDEMIRYTIDTSLNTTVYSSGVVMAFDVENGLEYYVSESSFNKNESVFTHKRTGFFSISAKTYSIRNSNDRYYVYQIDTYD